MTNTVLVDAFEVLHTYSCLESWSSAHCCSPIMGWYHRLWLLARTRLGDGHEWFQGMRRTTKRRRKVRHKWCSTSREGQGCQELCVQISYTIVCAWQTTISVFYLNHQYKSPFGVPAFPNPWVTPAWYTIPYTDFCLQETFLHRSKFARNALPVIINMAVCHVSTWGVTRET